MSKLPPLTLTVSEAQRTLSRLLHGRTVVIEPTAEAKPEQVPRCRFGPGGDYVRDVMPEDVLGKK
jgi:hypothetical protein